MPYRKKLIEVALPLEAINIASAREKSIRHGHPSTLHLWWARRPLAAARAVIFSSLVDDPDAPDALPAFVEACRQLPKGPNVTINDTPRMRLFDFIERLVQWESTTNEAILTTARELINIATEGNPPPLLDPFAGGGSIPLEAQRLGLEAHASDLNPVAVMFNKAQIEIPPRFANLPPVNPRDRERIDSSEGWKGAAGLAADVRYYGKWMCEKAWERIGHLYPTHNGETVIAWIWARTVKCPNPACGAQMPLIDSFDLTQKKNREFSVDFHVNEQRNGVNFFVKSGKSKLDSVINRKGALCIVCNVPVAFDYLRSEGKAHRIGMQLVAIVTEGKDGRSYYSPNEDQTITANVEIPETAPNAVLPDIALGFRIQAYGMTHWSNLFTPRQLVALTTFSDLVTEARQLVMEQSENDTAYADAISTYLAMAVDRLTQRCNSLSGWDKSADQVRTLFSRQAISMVWDFAEANPFSSSTGSFEDSPEWIAEVLESTKFNFLSNRANNSACQLDAASTLANVKHPMIST